MKPVKLKAIVISAVSVALIATAAFIAIPEISEKRVISLTNDAKKCIAEENYSEAVEKSEKALEINPDNGDAEALIKRALFEGGLHYAADGDYNAAMKQYEKLCEYQPSKENRIVLARVYAALGDEEKVDGIVSALAQKDDTDKDEIYSEIYEIEIIAEATCVSDGEAVYHSMLGEAERTVAVPKNDAHQWDNGTVTKPASCKECGEKEYLCILCGEKKNEILEKDNNHKWGEWKTVKAPTCALEGEKEHCCKICGKIEKETVKPTGKHTLELLSVTKKRTCTEDGEQILKCSVCGKEQTEVLTATGHDYGDWIETKKTTKYEAGSHYRICSVCKYELVEEIPRLPYPEIDRLLDNATLNPKKTGFSELDKKIEKVFSEIFTDENTTSEKVYACYDYLIANYTYAPINPSYYWDFLMVNPYYYTEKGKKIENAYDCYAVFSAISAITAKSGTCVEFSNTFAVMMQRIGLFCFPVNCQAQAGSEYSGHTLTFITLDGNDYVFDPQIEQILAESYGGCYYGRFGKTTDELGAKYKDYCDVEESRKYFGNFLVDKKTMNCLEEMVKERKSAED